MTRLAVIIALLVSWNVRAASLYTETFSNTNGGWRDRLVGGMILTNVTSGGNPGGALQGTFPASFIPPAPPDDAFVATGGVASGVANFIGNYDEVDAWVLGFDFNALQVLPSELSVWIFGGVNGAVNRSLNGAVVATNSWYSFRIPLLAAGLGGWQGSVANFAAIMTNVTQVEVRITRKDNLSDTPQQSYLLDNVFLDRVPEAFAGGSDGSVVWLHLRTGENYRLEASADLNQSSWSLVDAFVATSSVYAVNLVSTNPVVTYRMLME